MGVASEILNDFSRIASGAAGSFWDIKREIEDAACSKLEKLIQNKNLISKEEFDTLQAMLAKSLKEQEKLKERLEALESQPNHLK